MLNHRGVLIIIFGVHSTSMRSVIHTHLKHLVLLKEGRNGPHLQNLLNRGLVGVNFSVTDSIIFSPYFPSFNTNSWDYAACSKRNQDFLMGVGEVGAIHLMCFIDSTAHLLHGLNAPRVHSLKGKSKSLTASSRKFKSKWKYDYEAIS